MDFYIDTPKRARRAVRELRALGHVPIAVDSEFRPSDNKVRLISYSWGEGQFRVVHGDLVKEFYGDFLADPENLLIYQNFKADAEQFAALGMDTRKSFHADTMVMGCLVDETLVSHSLKAQAAHFLEWPRQEYSKLFSYVPVGKTRPIVMDPIQVMDELPGDALLVRSKEEWQELMLLYAGHDAESTWVLYDHHKAKLQEIGYWESYLKIDAPFTLTLMECSQRGVRLNTPALQLILRKVDISILRCQHAFRTAASNPQLNLNSIPQMSKLLLEEWGWPVREDFINFPTKREKELAAKERRTARGSPMLSAEVFKWWRDEHGFALADVKLAYNNAKTLKGTFLEGLINGADEDGRLRSDFNQLGGKRTGRISSRKRTEEIDVEKTLKSGVVKITTKKIKVGANLQNIPARKEKDPYGIRAAFVAPRKGDITARGTIAHEDYQILVADFSGFELVMVIHWCSKLVKNSKMLMTMQRYGSPSSIHAFTAIKLYADKKHTCTLACKHKHAEPGKTFVLGKIPMDDWKLVKQVFPDQYLISKNNNFNLLYGGSAKMMARLRGLDVRDQSALDQCQEEANNWNDLYPEVGVYQRYMIKRGYKKGWVPTISGRRIHVSQYLEDEDPGTRGHGERVCTNGPSQGSAADIVKVAMNLVERDPRFASYNASLLFSIHDELLSEAPKSTAADSLARKIEIMKTPFEKELSVKLEVEGGIGNNWVLAKS